MGCFCHAALAPLSSALPQINVSAQLGLPGAAVPIGLSQWLGQRGLPAAPWAPEPAWLAVPLPRMMMSAQTVATISALASLRAQAMSQYGLDLLKPQQAQAFARIVATMNARLSAMEAAHAAVDATAWRQLAMLNAAIDQVTQALNAGLLLPTPGLLLALTVPGGVPMPRWGGFLTALRALAPMIAATTQLGVSLAETAELSAALRVLARLALPALAAPQFMAGLTSALSAVAQLSASLGVSPLQLGFPAVQMRVQARLAALTAALAARFGMNLAAGGLSPEAMLAVVLAQLPQLPVVPTSFATSAVVQAALQAQPVAALNWQVPAAPPAMQIGLPTVALTAQLQAALNVRAVQPAPCASGCDAARLMRTLAA